jgi:hypothetical protein
MVELLDLKSLEGRFSPHDNFLKTQLERRKVCLSLLENPQEAASFIGGTVENPRSDEKWSIAKELFPGIIVHVLFRTDEEFGSRLEVFFSGERVRSMPGEDLAELAVAVVNHLIRYIRSTVPEDRLPEICLRI